MVENILFIFWYLFYFIIFLMGAINQPPKKTKAEILENMSYETEEYNIYDPSFSTSSVDELCSIFSGASSIENNCEHVKSITEDTRKNFE